MHNRTHTHRTPESRAAQPSPPLPTYANAPPPPRLPWLSPPPQEREKELSRIESQLRDARSSGESEDQLASRERARSEVASSLDQKKGEREQNLKRQQQTLEARFRNFFKVRATSAPPHLVGRFPDDTPFAPPRPRPIGSFTPTLAALTATPCILPHLSFRWTPPLMRSI